MYLVIGSCAAGFTRLCQSLTLTAVYNYFDIVEIAL